MSGWHIYIYIYILERLDFGLLEFSTISSLDRMGLLPPTQCGHLNTDFELRIVCAFSIEDETAGLGFGTR